MRKPDVATLEVRAPEPIEAPVISAAQEAEQHTVPVEVEYIPILHARPTMRLLVEELPQLVITSRDSQSVCAFKSVFCEVVASSDVSRLRVVAHDEEEQSSAQNKPRTQPMLSDFIADVMLCAKRTLGTSNYLLLTQHADEGFIFWEQVPQRVRIYIAERVGAKLLERRIFKKNGTGTRQYWRDDFMLRHGGSCS